LSRFAGCAKARIRRRSPEGEARRI
jgi:hypothetical protein